MSCAGHQDREVARVRGVDADLAVAEPVLAGARAQPGLVDRALDQQRGRVREPDRTGSGHGRGRPGRGLRRQVDREVAGPGPPPRAPRPPTRRRHGARAAGLRHPRLCQCPPPRCAGSRLRAVPVLVPALCWFPPSRFAPAPALCARPTLCARPHAVRPPPRWVAGSAMCATCRPVIRGVAVIYSRSRFPGRWAMALAVLAPRGADPGWIAADRAGRHPSTPRATCWPGSTSSPTGCARWGLRPGRRHRGAAAERLAALEVYLAALQGGWYLHPDQLALHRARDRLHRGRLRGEGVLRARAVRRGRARPPPTRPGSRPAARLSYGDGARVHPGGRACWPASPPSCPPDRTAGATMHYTSGTTGRPKGVRRALSGLGPRRGGGADHGCCCSSSASRRASRTCTWSRSPNYHTAVTLFGGARHSPGPHAGLHGRVGRRAGAGPGRAVPGDEHAHGADPLQADAVAARGRPGAGTTCRRCAG